jgi:hypothetical protein
LNPRTHPPDIDGLRDRVLSPAPLTRLGDPRRTIISASLDTDIPKFYVWRGVGAWCSAVLLLCPAFLVMDGAERREPR